MQQKRGLSNGNRKNVHGQTSEQEGLNDRDELEEAEGKKRMRWKVGPLIGKNWRTKEKDEQVQGQGPEISDIDEKRGGLLHAFAGVIELQAPSRSNSLR